MTQPTPVVTDLPAIAARLLDIAAAALSPSPSPSRTFRSIGPPVWPLGDACEQLAVWVGPMQPGQPGEARPGQYEPSPNRLRSYTLTLEVARCHEADNPTPTSMDTAAGQHVADFQALDSMVRGLGYSGKVHDDELQAAGVLAVAAGPITTVPPSGGMAAVRAQLTVTVT